ncbi:bifunctional hydroxymethylpyrimidine kinase/phosphomethylpyrimidine kinase [Corticibacterium sp. UT-5YL-CI-8]|nr:bifunctional hydroxymethylpyrimidine kinase/phosphomethylpyrimidine kinase [Tianweitania sp. UT-5YL-CI-8]
MTTKARSAAGLNEAMRILARHGAGAAAVTGCVLDDTESGSVETVVWTPDRLTRTSVARLPIRLCGTGDLFTALLIARLCEGRDLHEAGSGATGEILAVLRRTQAAGSQEMQIAGFPFVPIKTLGVVS